MSMGLAGIGMSLWRGFEMGASPNSIKMTKGWGESCYRYEEILGAVFRKDRLGPGE